jgi:hypothetical protein
VLRKKAGAALLAGCSAIGVLVAGCGDDSPEMSSAARGFAEELSAAVDRTLALDSFRIVGSTEAGDASQEYQASYHAPDRAQLVSFDGTITIYDGDEIYTTTPDADGRFVRIPAGDSGAQPVEQLLRPLHMLEAATHVRREPDRYVVGLEGADEVIEAEIEDGLVTHIRVGWQEEPGTFTVTHDLSDFDAAPLVKPPPRDQIVEWPSSPECQPGGQPAEIEFCISDPGQSGTG